MSKTFSSEYAGAYDTLYKHKDYEAECDLIEGLLKLHGHEASKSILDLGCGTGNHAVILARRGYEVAGVEHDSRSPHQGLGRLGSEEHHVCPR